MHEHQGCGRRWRRHRWLSSGSVLHTADVFERSTAVGRVLMDNGGLVAA